MNQLAQKTIEYALKDEGVHETNGNNAGPIIDKMLAIVHLPPGNPWCCAAAAYWIYNAATELVIVPEIQLAASVLKMWNLNQSLVIPSPEPGCLALRDEGVNSLGHKIGHLMVVIDINPDGTLKVISGNTTSADPNSRDGGCVAVQNRPMSQFINGYGFISIQ
jgi:hypothetical protein